ncbi:MAG: hypothetical protein ISS87_00505, partial [Candidatus Pacebacteria bacterium]|nr:hypothetical protein [Candidatus Paceibacterota bacterium]
GQQGKIKIWLVDGNKIRSESDIEFTNFGHHFTFPYIPKYEFWLDKEAIPNESRFFIERMLTEWNLLNKGAPCHKVKKIAEEKERAERKKFSINAKQSILKKSKAQKKAHCRLLQKIGEIKIWLVYGRLARELFDLDFVEGGHDLVYNYIPKNEIWIDNDLLAKERKYVIVHELYERLLMEKGLSYNQAHKKASQLEWRARHNLKISEKYFKENNHFSKDIVLKQILKKD